MPHEVTITLHLEVEDEVQEQDALFHAQEILGEFSDENIIVSVIR
jgi:hypothetical protein